MIAAAAAWGPACVSPDAAPLDPAPDDTAAGEETGTAAMPADDTGAALPGASLESVTWRVAWRTDDLLPAQRGGAFQVRTDKGDVFELHRGWVVLYGMGLEPCEAQARRPSPGTAPVPPPALLPALLGATLLPTAHAHAGADHASALPQGVALAVHQQATVTLDTLAFDPDRFCQVGLGLFRADSTIQQLPDEVDLDGLGLLLEGELLAAGDSAWTDLQLATAVPVETDRPLSVDDPDGTTVTLTLDLAAAMQDLWLADDDPVYSAKLVLLGLASTSTPTLGLPETP